MTSNNIVTTKEIETVIVQSTGARGAKGSTILRGSGLPSGSVGIISDYYIDTATNRIYGPKPTDTAWNYSVYIDLQGVDGASFLTGIGAPSNSLGNNGDTYLDVSTGKLYTKANGTYTAGDNIVQPVAVSFVYEKQSASSLWDITHNLGYRPAVTVSDYGQNNVECDIEHVSANRLKLTFTADMSGYAYLS
jgi:hypothetical protein